MSRLTNKDDRGRYYTVEEKILIANEPVNPTTTWIVHNENRRYGSPIEKLGKLEDLEEEFPFSIEKMQEIEEIYVLDDDKLKKYKLIGFNFKEKQIYFWMDFCPMYLSFDEYKKMFWLREDKSE